MPAVPIPPSRAQTYFFSENHRTVYIFSIVRSRITFCYAYKFFQIILLLSLLKLFRRIENNTLFRILFGIQQEVSFIQGQGASNSSSSPNTPSASATQQQIESGKSNNMDSESTPNLTHATRVSPATVRMRKTLYGWNCEFSEFHQLLCVFSCFHYFPLSL